MGTTVFFAAVARSPLTGIVVCVGTTATTGVLVPMLLEADVTMIVSTLVRSAPINGTLRRRTQGQSARY